MCKKSSPSFIKITTLKLKIWKKSNLKFCFMIFNVCQLIFRFEKKNGFLKLWNWKKLQCVRKEVKCTFCRFCSANSWQSNGARERLIKALNSNKWRCCNTDEKCRLNRIGLSKAGALTWRNYRVRQQCTVTPTHSTGHESTIVLDTVTSLPLYANRILTYTQTSGMFAKRAFPAALHSKIIIPLSTLILYLDLETKS